MVQNRFCAEDVEIFRIQIANYVDFANLYDTNLKMHIRMHLSWNSMQGNLYIENQMYKLMFIIANVNSMEFVCTNYW